MADQMEVIIRKAAETLISRLKVQDPDVISDTVAYYWYQIAVKGHRPGWNLIRWSLASVKRGMPFPGTGQTNRNRDAFKSARNRIVDIRPQKRFVAPPRAAVIHEEIALVEGEIRTRSERAGFTMLLLGQDSQEAAALAGITPSGVRKGVLALSKRCRAAARTRR